MRRATPGVWLVGVLVLFGCSEADSGEAPRSEVASLSASKSPTAVEMLIETGLAQVKAEKLGEAEGTFNSVLSLEPDNVYALYNLGYIAQVREDVATAVTQYNAAISADPEFAPALYNLAILTEGADLAAAADLYRRVLAVKPEDAATYMRLGFALEELGEDQEAEEMLARGIELDPAMADVEPPKYK